MFLQAGRPGGCAEALLEGIGINAHVSIIDLSRGTADTLCGTGACHLTGHALSSGRVPGGAGRTHIDTLASSVEVLLSSAGLEVHTLSQLETVVGIDAGSTHPEGVNSQTVIGECEALSIDAVLVGGTGDDLLAMTSVVQVESTVALNAVTSLQVEGLTVDVSTHTRSKAELLSLLATSEGGGDLQALSIVYSIVTVVACETGAG